MKTQFLWVEYLDFEIHNPPVNLQRHFEFRISNSNKQQQKRTTTRHYCNNMSHKKRDIIMYHHASITWKSLHNTLSCRHNRVQCNTIFNAVLQWFGSNVAHRLNSQKHCRLYGPHAIKKRVNWIFLRHVALVDMYIKYWNSSLVMLQLHLSNHYLNLLEMLSPIILSCHSWDLIGSIPTMPGCHQNIFLVGKYHYQWMNA